MRTSGASRFGIAGDKGVTWFLIGNPLLFPVLEYGDLLQLLLAGARNCDSAGGGINFQITVGQRHPTTSEPQEAADFKNRVELTFLVDDDVVNRSDPFIPVNLHGAPDQFAGANALSHHRCIDVDDLQG